MDLVELVNEKLTEQAHGADEIDLTDIVAYQAVIEAAKAWFAVARKEMQWLKSQSYNPHLMANPHILAMYESVCALEAAERNDPYSGMQVREASPEQVERHEAAVRQAFADAEKGR